MATFEDRLIALNGRIAAAEARIDQTAAAVGADAMSRYAFRKLLTDAEMDAWTEMVELIEAKAPADRTAEEKQKLRAWRDFYLPPAIELSAPETQAAIYALHVWGVLTQERADRVAQGLPPG